MSSDIFNNYIEDRLEENYQSLLDNQHYLDLSRKFNFEYKKLCSVLSPNNKKDLDFLLDTKNKLLSEEIYLSYKLGLSDGFDLRKNIN